MSGARNRTKGHNLERTVASQLREVGFEYARTSRSESKTLDDCGVDICNVPFLLQCKSGYDNRYPRFPEIYNSIRENIAAKYDKDSPLRLFPIVLVHKPTRDVTYWSFDETTALNLIKSQQQKLDILEEVVLVLTEAKNEILSLEELVAAQNIDEDSDIMVSELVSNNQVYDKIYELKGRIESLLK
jgi:hypothetical protein